MAALGLSIGIQNDSVFGQGRELHSAAGLLACEIRPEPDAGSDQEDVMEPIARLMLTALAVAGFGAATIPGIQANVKSLGYAIHQTHAADPTAPTSYADWQGALHQSFGARFLARGVRTDAIASQRQPTTTYVFQDMDKMQTVAKTSGILAVAR
jgi:uncharacterized protein (DUF1330 family)